MEVQLSGFVIDEAVLDPSADTLDDAAILMAIAAYGGGAPETTMPEGGWRLLKREGATAVAAAPQEGGTWTVVELDYADRRWTANRHSWDQQPQPTPAQAGQGFELAWPTPEIAVPVGHELDLHVLLRNVAAPRRAWTGAWYAWGVVFDLDTGRPLPVDPDPFGISLQGFGFDLRPGQFVQLPVLHQTLNSSRLPEGYYGLRASFSELALETSPGRLHVTGRRG